MRSEPRIWPTIPPAAADDRAGDDRRGGCRGRADLPGTLPALGAGVQRSRSMPEYRSTAAIDQAARRRAAARRGSRRRARPRSTAAHPGEQAAS
jgi:hypothetical protein